MDSHQRRISNIIGEDVKNFSKNNKALMALFSVVEAKLDKAIKDADKPEFDNWDVKQTYYAGYRKVLRDLLTLKPNV